MAKQIIKMSDESYIEYSPTWWIKWDKDPKKREKNPTAQDEFDKKCDEFHMFLDMYSYLSIDGVLIPTFQIFLSDLDRTSPPISTNILL